MQVTVRASSTLLSTGDGHFIDAGDSIYDIIEGPFNVAIGKKAKFITFKP